MSDEKKLNKLKRDKTFWRKVSTVLLTKTGIIDREYVDKQLSETETKIKEENMKWVILNTESQKILQSLKRRF